MQMCVEQNVKNYKLAKKFFPNLIYLFIIWKFHTMYQITLFLPISPRPTLEPTLPPTLPNTPSSNFGCSYTHWGIVNLSVAIPLKITESFPTHTPARSHYL